MKTKQQHPLVGKRCILIPTSGAYQPKKGAVVVGVTATQIKVHADGEVNIMGEPHPPRRFKRSNFYQHGRQHEFPGYKIRFETDEDTQLASL